MRRFPLQTPCAQSEGNGSSGEGDEASELWRRMREREQRTVAPKRILVAGACALGALILAVGLWIVVFQ